MYNYLISNRELIIAILIASVRAFLEGFILLCMIQTLVYQLSDKRISLYNILVSDLIIKKDRKEGIYENTKGNNLKPFS